MVVVPERRRVLRAGVVHLRAEPPRGSSQSFRVVSRRWLGWHSFAPCTCAPPRGPPAAPFARAVHAADRQAGSGGRAARSPTSISRPLAGAGLEGRPGHLAVVGPHARGRQIAVHLHVGLAHRHPVERDGARRIGRIRAMVQGRRALGERQGVHELAPRLLLRGAAWVELRPSMPVREPGRCRRPPAAAFLRRLPPARSRRDRRSDHEPRGHPCGPPKESAPRPRRIRTRTCSSIDPAIVFERAMPAWMRAPCLQPVVLDEAQDGALVDERGGRRSSSSRRAMMTPHQRDAGVP